MKKKILYTNRKKWQHKNATKKSITQRLRTYIGRSAGATNSYHACLQEPNLPTNQSRVIKRTHIQKNFKKK